MAKKRENREKIEKLKKLEDSFIKLSTELETFFEDASEKLKNAQKTSSNLLKK